MLSLARRRVRSRRARAQAINPFGQLPAFQDGDLVLVRERWHRDP